MSSLNSILLHTVIIGPVCQYLLTSPKFPKPRNFIFAIAFLCAVALAGEVSEWSSRPTNYYRILDVDRTSSASELKKAYRDATLKYHPDKNKSPEAPLLFQQATDAYETLNDAELKKLYERYGPTVVKDVRARSALSQRSDTETLIGMASLYLMWAVLTYLLTMGKQRGQARTWSAVGLIVSAFVEFQMTFAGWDPAASVFTRTTIHEKVALMHSLYPAFMHGCILIAQFTFVDLDALQLLMLQTVLNQQQELRDILRHVVQCVDKKHGASVAAAGGVTGAASGTESTDEAALSVRERMKRQETATAKAMQETQQKQGKGGIPGWMIMIGLYFVFNYLLK